MKIKNAFTLIEVLVVISIIAILAALILPPTLSKFENTNKKSQQVDKYGKLNLGDTVYIDGLDITGRVNRIWTGFGAYKMVDLLVKGTNGLPAQMEGVNAVLLKKVVTPEEWKNE